MATTTTPIRKLGQSFERPQVSSKNIIEKNIKFFQLVLALVLIAVSAYTVSFYYETFVKPTVIPTTNVQNVFVDLNGDGRIDLIITGDVIFNDGSPNFPSAQGGTGMP
jgi:hypothetical protein